MSGSAGESMASLLVCLERGILPSSSLLHTLLEQVASGKAEGLTQMCADLWRLSIKLNNDLAAKEASARVEKAEPAESVREILCGMYLLTFYLYRQSSSGIDIESGLILFIVALRTLGELIENHWQRQQTELGALIWNKTIYEDIIGCLSNLFKVTLQPSFLFKAGNSELLHLIFTYHVLELKLLFIFFYDGGESGVLLDRLVYVSSFYLGTEQQDILAGLVLENLTDQPYRPSIYKLGVPVLERIVRTLKQIFDCKTASKQTLASILRALADISILTTLMKKPVSVGYSLDFCVTKAHELCPCPHAHAMLKVRQTVAQVSEKTRNAGTDSDVVRRLASEANKDIATAILDALDLFARSQEGVTVLFPGLTGMISFLAANGFVLAAVRACKSVLDHLLTGLLVLREDSVASGACPFRMLVRKDGVVDPSAMQLNRLYAGRLVCATVDALILSEGSADTAEMENAMRAFANIPGMVSLDLGNPESKEVADMLCTRIVSFIAMLTARGDISGRSLLEFTQSIKDNTHAVILTVKYCFAQLDLEQKKPDISILTLKGSKASQTDSSSDAVPRDRDAALDQNSVFGMCASLLRDIQSSFDTTSSKQSTRGKVIRSSGASQYEFYYLFILTLLYSQDHNSALELIRHVSGILETDDGATVADFEVLGAAIGQYSTHRFGSSATALSQDNDSAVALAVLFLTIVQRYLGICVPYNKYLRLLIEHSVDLVNGLLVQLQTQQCSNNTESSVKLLAGAKELTEMYIFKVGMKRFMPYEIENLQQTLYKLVSIGCHMYSGKNKLLRQSGQPEILLSIYSTLLRFTVILEKKEPATKRAFSTAGKAKSLTPISFDGPLTFPSQASFAVSDGPSAAFSATSNVNRNVGLMFYSLQFGSQKQSLLKQGSFTFAGSLCQCIVSGSLFAEGRLPLVANVVTALTDYLVTVCEDIKELGSTSLQYDSLAFTVIPLTDVLAVIHEVDQAATESESQPLATDTPLLQLLFQYAVILVLFIAQLSSQQGKKVVVANAGGSISTDKQRHSKGADTVFLSTSTTQYTERYTDLIEQTLLLSFEANCQGITHFLLSKYGPHDPLLCTQVYITAASEIKPSILIELLTTLVSICEKHPSRVAEDKLNHLISQLDKVVVTSTQTTGLELSSIISKLKDRQNP